MRNLNHTIHMCNSRIFRAPIFFTALLLSVFTATKADTKNNAAYVGFQLLEEPTNPIAIGMGSAGAAFNCPGDDNGCRGFAYYNPALPALGKKPYLTAEYGQYAAGDLHRGHFETAWPFSRWFVGASIHTEAIDDIGRTYWDGKLSNSTFSSQLTSIALDIGFIRAESFAAGLCLSGIQERIAEYSAYAMSLSAGIIYDIIPGKLAAGAAGFHLGTATTMLDTTFDWGEGARLPKTARAGISWSDTLKSIGYSAVADIVFRNADKRIMVPVGLEIRPVPQMAIRTGKRFNHDTEIMNFGFGLSIAPLSTDVSFVVPKLVDDPEMKWLLSVTYTLKSSPQIKKRKSVTIPQNDAPVIKPAEKPEGDIKEEHDKEEKKEPALQQEPVIIEDYIIPIEQDEDTTQSGSEEKRKESDTNKDTLSDESGKNKQQDSTAQKSRDLKAESDTISVKPDAANAAEKSEDNVSTPEDTKPGKVQIESQPPDTAASATTKEAETKSTPADSLSLPEKSM